MCKIAPWSVSDVSKMKPLTPSGALQLLERLESLSDAQPREIIMKSPTSVSMEFSVQDAHRGFDWINIVFEIEGVSDARLLDDVNLKHADMSEGAAFVFDAQYVGFANGQHTTLSSMTEAQFYAIGNSVKYEERPFSEG